MGIFIVFVTNLWSWMKLIRDLMTDLDAIVRTGFECYRGLFYKKLLQLICDDFRADVSDASLMSDVFYSLVKTAACSRLWLFLG